MSCIKFPSTNNDLTKASSKGDINSYLSANSQLIDTANNAFGEGNWSHAITNQTIDFVDYVAGKYHAGCVTMVKLQLKNGIFHEAMGYSYLDGSSKGSVIQKVRLDSFNLALKQVFSYFGNEFTNLKKNCNSIDINTSISREIVQKKESISPIIPPPNTINKEPFDEVISMSQTDALMGTVDLDQLFDKSLNSNTTNNVVKDFTKTSVFHPTSTSGVGILKEKDKNSNIVINDKKIEVPKIAELKGNNSQSMDKTTINSKKEYKELPKTAIPTVMTEEEMRLERKRKQREMQEEFKRKQESKKLHMDSGNKPPPNPRY